MKHEKLTGSARARHPDAEMIIAAGVFAALAALPMLISGYWI